MQHPETADLRLLQGLLDGGLGKFDGACREIGIEEFVAEVLPDNTGMLQVFRDAGYQVERGFEDGVVAMRFPIDATETSVSVMLAPATRWECSTDRP